MNSGQPSSETARLARAVPIGLVAAACLFNAVAYLNELQVAAPDLNDDVFHFGLIQRMNAAWDAGGNPLDTWIGYWGQGFPVLRYYQHLPHFVVVLVYRLLGGTVPLHAVFDAATVLMLTLLPLSFYLGSRRLGATPMTAACIALGTVVLAADPSERHFLGFQPRSFLWSGGGLFTQLAAMVALPLALGATSHAILAGRRFAPAIAWLSVTWLSHLLLGYIACLLGLVLLLRPEARDHRWRVALRLGAIYAGVAVVAAYLLLPTLLEGQWLARSAWEPAEYWDSYGASRVIAALLTGGLLDGDRFPVLTMLAGFGAVLAGRAWLRGHRGPDDPFAFVALGMFLLALVLFFGRPTWGRLLDLLPFSSQLPFHRFICAVQFGALLLAGLALSRIAQWLGRWSRHELRVAATGVAALVILSPAIVSTAGYARQNSTWRKDAAADNEAARAPLERAFADFSALDHAVPGRGYAGASWDWGRDFRVGGAQVYHRWSAHDLPGLGYMYHTMGLNSDLEPAFDASRRDHHELFNVRYLLAEGTQRLPAFAERRLTAPGLVSAFVDTEGYFGVVGSAAYFRYARGEADALRDLNRAYIASDWHAGRHVIRIGWRDGDTAGAGERSIEAAGPFALGTPPARQAPRGRIISSGGSGDRYYARVRLDDPGLIVFRMTFHPNWKATLDGHAVETVLLSPGYIGIPAPAGEHALELAYLAPRWTRALLWAGLALLGLVACGDLRAARRACRIKPASW